MLPDLVSPDEKLARVYCGSSKFKDNKKKISKNNENEIEAKPSLFFDERNPIELSVNRISTLSNLEAHQLGIEHRDLHQPNSIYWGYALVIAQNCYDLNCSVKKDDIGGTKPFHANIIYQGETMDIVETATKLAFHSQFIMNTP